MQNKHETGSKDPILESLGALPALDVDSAKAEAIRHHALAELQQRKEPPMFEYRLLSMIYHFAMEPAFIGSISIIYLYWAIVTVSQILLVRSS